MAEKEIHLERLVGRRVLTQSGKTVGHIEEIRAEREGEEWVIQEYLLGPHALLERLFPGVVGPTIRRVLRLPRQKSVFALPWDKLDLTDPEKPTVLDSGS